jgi:hypothetical protein
MTAESSDGWTQLLGRCERDPATDGAPEKADETPTGIRLISCGGTDALAKVISRRGSAERAG